MSLFDRVETAKLSPFSFWETFRAKVLRRKFVRNVGDLTIANVVGAALSFTQGILVARWLGPELYGVAALVMSYPSLIYSFFDARSGEMSVKYLSEFQARNERGRVLAICKLGYLVDLALVSLAFLLVALSAHWAAENIAQRPEAALIIIIYTIGFLPRSFVGTSKAIFTVLGRFRVIALVDTLMTLLRAVLVLGLVLSGWEVAGVVWGTTIVMIATGLLYGSLAWVLMLRTWGGSPLHGNLRALDGRKREITRFLVYTDLNALVGIIPKQLDVILVGYFRGSMEVGYYKLAKSLSAVVGYLAGPLQSVTYPELVRLTNLKNRQLLCQKVRRLALEVGLPLGAIALVGSLLTPFILPLLVGDNYLPAIAAAQILFGGSAIWLACFWIRPLYIAQGNLRLWLAITTSVVAISAISYPMIIPRWGYLGLSIWSSVMQLLGHGTAVFLWLRSNSK